MNHTGISAATLLAFALVLWPSEGRAEVERVFWDARPIRIHLQVGAEQIIRFLDSVQAAVPADLQSVLSAQAVNEALYLNANEEFSRKRIMVRSTASGRVYLFDLSAGLEPVPNRIVEVVQKSSEESWVPGNNGWTYASLTRYAAQQLFAPTRLLRREQGVSRVPVFQEAFPLVRGSRIEARPLAAWKAARLHVTALELVNLGSLPATLRPDEFRGRWNSATLHRFALDAAGGTHDRTVGYLISEVPFLQALRRSELAP